MCHASPALPQPQRRCFALKNNPQCCQVSSGIIPSCVACELGNRALGRAKRGKLAAPPAYPPMMPGPPAAASPLLLPCVIGRAAGRRGQVGVAGHESREVGHDPHRGSLVWWGGASSLPAHTRSHALQRPDADTPGHGGPLLLGTPGPGWNTATLNSSERFAALASGESGFMRRRNTTKTSAAIRLWDGIHQLCPDQPSMTARE